MPSPVPRPLKICWTIWTMRASRQWQQFNMVIGELNEDVIAACWLVGWRLLLHPGLCSFCCWLAPATVEKKADQKKELKELMRTWDLASSIRALLPCRGDEMSFLTSLGTTFATFYSVEASQDGFSRSKGVLLTKLTMLYITSPHLFI